MMSTALFNLIILEVYHLTVFIKY